MNIDLCKFVISNVIARSRFILPFSSLARSTRTHIGDEKSERRNGTAARNTAGLVGIFWWRSSLDSGQVDMTPPPSNSPQNDQSREEDTNTEKRTRSRRRRRRRRRRRSLQRRTCMYGRLANDIRRLEQEETTRSVHMKGTQFRPRY